MTGDAAVVVDQIKYFVNPIVWVFVLSLSFVVLLLVFRSLVIAVKAIILNLLSTGAAAIMVAVFGDFFVGLTGPSIRQVGLGLAVAVLLDATIVRSLLLPAAMRLLGEANWWMPQFLNFLPAITIETEPEEAYEEESDLELVAA